MILPSNIITFIVLLCFQFAEKHKKLRYSEELQSINTLHTLALPHSHMLKPAFTSSETRRIVVPDAEDHTIVSSFIWTKKWNVTDRQTDRITLAITAVSIVSNADVL